MSNDDYGFGGAGGYNTTQSANISFGEAEGHKPASSATIKDITTSEFMQEVVEASMKVPVLVDFWAPWCGPCKQLAPALEAAVLATAGKVRLVKMNIDDHPEVAGQLGVQSIPAVFAFKDGKPVDAFTGAKNEAEIREFIGKIAGDDGPSQLELLLEKAAELVAEDAILEASEIYSQILTVEPQNLTARVGMGKLYLAENNLEGAQSMLQGLSDEQLSDNDIAGLVTALELAEQADKLGDTTELEAKLEANTDDHQTRLELAIALNAINKREEAADHLLEIIRKKPDWNDNAARTQLLQFFEAWGITDETTMSARRKLSSLLFS